MAFLNSFLEIIYFYCGQIYAPEEREDNASLNSATSVANLPGFKKKSEQTQMIKFDTWLNLNQQVLDYAIMYIFEQYIYMKYLLVLPQVDQSMIVFMKIDVQGFEEEVLRGSADFLRRHGKHITIEAEFSPTLIRSTGKDPITILQFMHSSGFKFLFQNAEVKPEHFQNFVSQISSQIDIIFYKK
jgi:hypothetical protein